MTNGTTSAKKPRSTRWVWFASIGVHVIGAAVLGPFLVSRMEADRQKQEELTEQVRQRQERLAEQQRERREHIRLTEEQDRQLKEDARQRVAREIQQHLERLREAREQLLEARLHAFRQVEQRDAADFLSRELEPLRKELEQIPGELSNLEKSLAQIGRPDLEPIEEGNAALEGMLNELEEMATGDAESFSENARQLADIAVDWRKKLDQRISKYDRETQPELRNRHGELRDSSHKIAELALAAEGTSSINSTEGAAEDIDLPEAAEPENIASASAPELYEAATEIEDQVNVLNRDVRAAELAVTANMTFRSALDAITARDAERPSFDQLVSEQVPPTNTVADLNAYREGLQRAAQETEQMASAAESVVGQTQMLPGQQMSAAQRLAAESARAAELRNAGARGYADFSMLGFGGGDGNSSLGLKADRTGRGAQMQRDTKPRANLQLPQEMIKAKAMPGRMFTSESLRKGWLYLDTWYVIGPWENRSKIDYKNIHPPEYEINFDASYKDGKFANKEGHPYRELKWDFLQSDQISVEPRHIFAESTYYAYTEVHFDQDRDMLLAVASDDAARLWLNNSVVWEDNGLSAWNMGEGFRKVRFKQGFNTLLLRIENGPTHCVWSVLLCPDDR